MRIDLSLTVDGRRMAEEPSPATAVTVVGAIAVSVGAYLPWFRIDPLFDPLSPTFPQVYGPFAEAGLHGPDLLMLGGVGCLLYLRVVGGRRRALFPLSALVGAAIILYCLRYVLFSPAVGFVGQIVPAGGWYLTVVGGCALVAAGVLHGVGGQN
jgi:hypothetical protein